MRPCVVCGRPTSCTFEGDSPAEQAGQPMCPTSQSQLHGTTFTGCASGKCGVPKQLPED